MEKESESKEATSSLEFEAIIEDALKAILTELGVTKYPDNFSYTNLIVSKEKGFDLTLNVFAFAKDLKKKPDELAQAVFDKLEAIKPACFAGHLRTGAYIQLKLTPYPLAVAAIGEFVLPHAPLVGKNVIIEYSSPNSNKPQHLGHVRNNCLGSACANLLTSQGNKVTKIALLNNRGVHICKSMVAYKHFGEGSTPESTGMKSDHFVGKYYVLFETVFQKEFAAWLESAQAQEEFGKWQASSGGKTAVQKAQKEHQKVVEKAKKAGNPPPEFDAFKIFKSEYKNYYMNNFSAIGKEALEMLVLGEANDQPTRDLWTMMNGWVFEGFNTTYANYGVKFDQWERESEVYLYGKDSILKALDEGRLERFENGAVGCDLVEIGVLKPNTGEERKKALLRANGTAIYMTQDVGTALNRLAKYDATRMIYVVANEQDRHFEILFKLIEHMRPELKGGFFHLSYGMVNLPSGKMKSREGTVVDADDLLTGLSEMAYEITKSKWPELSDADLKFRADKIALAAIKFFILSFGPATTVLFDPAASLQFSGKAGPYLLYQYARTRSIFDKAQIKPEDLKWDQECLKSLGTAEEIEVLRKLYLFPKEVKLAATTLDPSKITDATYELTRSFNQFYKQKDKHQVVNCTDPVLKQARLLMCLAFSTCVRTGLELLGIECLERM